MTEPRLRISFIEFLNALPLGWGLLQGSLRGRHEVLLQTPAECAESLRSGVVDVGLIPAVEYLRIPGLRVIPGLAIASRREVRSVLFVSRVPLERVRRVAVDPNSRTSVALLKILLWEFYGRDGIVFEPVRPAEALAAQEYEGLLVIGNPALQLPLRQDLLVYDLAAEWYRFTGLPFVFAFWAVRPGLELGGSQAVFHESYREGAQSIPLIAEWYAGRLPLTSREIRRYLTHNLSYELDDAAQAGLQEFYRLVAAWKLVEAVRSPDFIRTVSS
ncbi:MAG: menaquinone biosynthesis protein [Acidobacteriota bacterium]